MVRNAVSGMAQIAVGIPVAFFLTPFVLHTLGDVRYGVWALLGALTGFAWIADMGMSGAITRYVARERARGDLTALSETVSTGLVVYAAVAVALTVLLLLLLDPLLALFRNAPLAGVELRVLVVATVGLALLRIAFQGYASVLPGLQRLDLSAWAGVVQTLVNAALVVVFLRAGWGLFGLVAALAGAFAVEAAIRIALTRRNLPGLRIAPGFVRMERAREITAFGIHVFTRKVANFVHYELDKILLAAFAPIAAVGWYNLAAMPVRRLRQIPETMMSPILPAVSDFAARGETDRTASLYREAHRYLGLSAVPLIGGVVAFAGPFVDLWLGPGYDVVAIGMVLLAVGHLFSLVVGPAAQTIVGAGEPKIVARMAIARMVLNGGLSLALIFPLGYFGVVGATTISFTAVAVAFLLWLGARRDAFSWVRSGLTRQYRMPVVFAALAGGAGWAVLTGLQGDGWLQLGTACVVFGGVYGAGMWATGRLRTSDLALLRSTFVPEEG